MVLRHLGNCGFSRHRYLHCHFVAAGSMPPKTNVILEECPLPATSHRSAAATSEQGPRPGQGFSDLSEHLHHLEGLFCQTVGPTPSLQFSISGEGPESLHFLQVPREGWCC